MHEPLTVVSELMSGSVRNILDQPRTESVKKLTWERRVEILLDAALGMAFLHGMEVVHRDSKSPSASDDFIIPIPPHVSPCASLPLPLPLPLPLSLSLSLLPPSLYAVLHMLASEPPLR